MDVPLSVSISLPFAPSSAAVARHELREWLVGLGVAGEAVEDSRLVLSELVGNAVRHASPLDDGTVQVAWSTETLDAIDISVTDGGSVTVPVSATPAVSAESGRGLSIVDALCNRWWLETTRTRSTVHALVGLASPIASPLAAPVG